VAASTCSEEEWSSWTCTLGWFVKGIFPGIDGTDVNCCVRSKNKRVIATGDDFGKISLFNYPASAPKQSHYTYTGHSSHVTRVKFLISIGGNDRSVFVWSTDILHSLDSADAEVQPEVEDDINEDEIGSLKKKEKRVG
jgi:WD40 repeat protein